MLTLVFCGMEARKFGFVIGTVSCLLCCWLLCSTVEAIPQQVPAVFSFGDSLGDPGNNNYITSLSKANFLPNGLDFPFGPTGRFTNGRTSLDVVGQLLGLPNFLPPYLAPSTKGPIILGGVNYASGAGGILDSSGFALIGRLSMNKQVEYFTNTRAQITQLIGEPAASQLVARSIIAINIGSNDFLNNYYIPLSPITNLTVPQFTNLVVSTFRTQLTSIYNLGGRKFAVAALGPLGCTPFQLTFRLRLNGECDEVVNEQVQTYNFQLRALLGELTANLPGSHFVYLNAYGVVADIISNHLAFGFHYGSMGCCGLGPYNGLLPCLPETNLCSNHADYVFWDPYHPTDAANVIIARRFYEGDINDVYPMNVKQLAAM